MSAFEEDSTVPRFHATDLLILAAAALVIVAAVVLVVFAVAVGEL